MSRADEFYGATDVDRVFPGGALVGQVPFDRAGRRKDRQDYERDKVSAVLMRPAGEHEIVELDPRTLHSSQGGLARAGVQHYMSDAYQRSGALFADHHQIGNQTPFVYARDGRNIILAGHHRATASLLRGEQFRTRYTEGTWGASRG